jgi:hypothetical protein
MSKFESLFETKGGGTKSRLEAIKEFFEDRGILPAHLLDAKLKAWETKFKQLEKGEQPYGEYYKLAAEANSWYQNESVDVQIEYDFMHQITEDGAKHPDIENTLRNYWSRMIDICPKEWYYLEERETVLDAMDFMYIQGKWTEKEFKSWDGAIFPSKTRCTPFISVVKNLFLIVSTGKIEGKGKEYGTKLRPPMEVWQGVVEAIAERWEKSRLNLKD